MPLDKFDHVLLKSLQRNCQIPLRELAEVVHLSTASIQRRIQKLKDEGYIQSNVAILEPNKLDKVITMVVEVQVEKTQAMDLHLLKESFSGPEIQQCYYVTGEADFLLVLLVPNMERFQEICDQLFHNNSNVKSFRTMVALDRVKVTLDVL
ncbi:AsnC family transcriptional regulator [Vibrio natriegens]|uniref:Lrp/AsnC family transcriptional regulator n=1 Tax=Vibrio natriegens TaxID=691 RepID=UPI000803C5AA|nr:Lrp/AsnC family transcriptional regulator [Vibrio natriegens]ANQ20224.1 AsnC family transcriptional regulator [Vibrio natriegens]ANQ27724.1 AsnC family transcriptional regulator [Vibrio natriegens]